MRGEHLVSEVSALDEFNKFLHEQQQRDDTWKFWFNFVFSDCFCYVSLFLAIRTSNWDLRVSNLKCMAPLFSAYNRPWYRKLIPQHLADIYQYPKDIINSFEKGAFTVKLKKGCGHAVALDEAHAMCINRDIKMAVARPTSSYHLFLCLPNQSTEAICFPVIPNNYSRSVPGNHLG